MNLTLAIGLAIAAAFFIAAFSAYLIGHHNGFLEGETHGRRKALAPPAPQDDPDLAIPRREWR